MGRGTLVIEVTTPKGYVSQGISSVTVMQNRILLRKYSKKERSRLLSDDFQFPGLI